MSCYLIKADSIKAWRHGTPNGVILVIEAQGHCECPQNARITAAPMPIEPPEFNLETCPCTAIGMFPYKAQGVFPGLSPSEVVVNTASGPKTIKVETVPEPATASAQPAPAPASDDTVTGYAYNSSDLGKAFSAAVAQLQQRFPGKTSASVTDMGFVGVGTPIGIAFTYVTMKNRS
jgi:hypothetical protein